MDISLTINGKLFKVNAQQIPVDITLNAFIRDRAKLTGTKYMCLEGGCGACVVSVTRRHPVTQQTDTFAVNSCLKSIYTCDGYNVTTIEGLGNRNAGYHPLQTAINRVHGSQCGYCTGGMIMNMHSLMQQHSVTGQPLTMTTVEQAFGGNMCRCTGYRPILDAFKSFACDASAALVHRCRGNDEELIDIEDLSVLKAECSSHRSAVAARSMQTIRSSDDGDDVWHSVSTLADLLATLSHIGDEPYMLVAGNTARGVKRLDAALHTFIDINPIVELHTIERSADCLTIGAAVTLSDCIRALRAAASSTCSGFKYCELLANHYEQIANVPIRNVGTIGGNLCFKNQQHAFPSDVFVTLDAADARLMIVDDKNVRTTVTMRQFFGLDMRKRVLYSVRLPLIDEAVPFRTYKITVRAQNAHAYVNAGFRVEHGVDGLVSAARICIGGISPQFTHAERTEASLIGRDLHTDTTLQQALASLECELQPDWVLPDAQPGYRKTLAKALFYRFVLSTCPNSMTAVSPRHRSGSSAIQRPLSSGRQEYATFKPNWPLTEPVPKYEGMEQATGEAKYINDMPAIDGELWACFAVSKRVHCRIAAIDATRALAVVKGARHFYAASDIPGKNNFTPVSIYTPFEEKIFAGIGDEVLFNGQPVGVMLADTLAAASKAAELVSVMYTKTVDSPHRSIFSMARDMLSPLLGAADPAEPAPKPIRPTIRDVLDDNHKPPGVPFSPTLAGAQKITGRFELAGQYHYHMETHTAICVPAERGHLDVYSSTQWVDFTQTAIGKMLRIPLNHIQMQVRRVGGAYGAKITRATLVTCAAALGAHLAQRPVRFVMQLEANMRTIGKRFGLIGDYSADVDAATGRVQRCTCTYSQDAGCSMNESVIVATTACFSNCYDATAWTVNGAMVLTDAASNTFCRSPGTLEGIAMGETMMEHIAEETGRSPVDVRLANLRSDSPMRAMMAEFVAEVRFAERRAEIEVFNGKNRWRKRALALVPMQWPLQYYGVIAAYVAVYHGDGSVVVTHGGIECGQGINTKVAQVVAYALGVPLAAVSVRPMDNVSSANSVLTGSSCTSEMACYAAKKACDSILQRMLPVRATLKAGYTWAELVAACYDKQIDLRETLQFRDTDVAAYMVYGVTACEIELDVLTGQYQLRRVDLWEDVGESMSPLVDLGQVEGAFVMGIGYWCTEQLVYDRSDGRLLTDRTWTYKPPGALDIPVDFRIKFIQNSPNPIVGVLRSKAVGEPAICMSVVILFALRYAINAARKDAGFPKQWLPMSSASTPEQVFMMCGNKIADFTL